MTPGINSIVTETPALKGWLDEEGIFCVELKEGKKTIKDYEPAIMMCKRLTENGKKLKMLADATHLKAALPGHVRNYLDREIPLIASARAVVSTSVLGKAIANITLFLNPLPYPVKIFSNEQEARAWLRELPD